MSSAEGLGFLGLQVVASVPTFAETSDGNALDGTAKNSTATTARATGRIESLPVDAHASRRLDRGAPDSSLMRLFSAPAPDRSWTPTRRGISRLGRCPTSPPGAYE